MWKVFTVLLTMSGATATAERSFSVLRRVKTDAPGLAVCTGVNAHTPGVPIDVTKVIDSFASRKNREMAIIY